jgi:hypothetical protein
MIISDAPAVEPESAKLVQIRPGALRGAPSRPERLELHLRSIRVIRRSYDVGNLLRLFFGFVGGGPRVLSGGHAGYLPNRPRNTLPALAGACSTATWVSSVGNRRLPGIAQGS